MTPGTSTKGCYEPPEAIELAREQTLPIGEALGQAPSFEAPEPEDPEELARMIPRG